jgi:hypothetical protein
MGLLHWYAIVRLIGFVLIVLASCPSTRPFKPVDVAPPPAGDSGPVVAALLQSRGTIEDPMTMLVAAPMLFAPSGATSTGTVRPVRRSPSTRLIYVPLRI